MNKIINWFEIPAEDINRAADFYNRLLSLEMEVVECGNEKYSFFPEKNIAVSGMISQAPGFKPDSNGPVLYFNASDKIDDMLGIASSAGGKVLREKTKIEAEGRGSFALILDSEGNRIGLYTS